MLLALTLFTSALVENRPLESTMEAEQVVEQFFSQVGDLPRYMEAGYSPLGRSPVVDVMLADPLYIPTYANHVASEIKRMIPSHQLYDLEKMLWTHAMIPINGEKPHWQEENTTVPTAFAEAFPKEIASILFQYWSLFLNTSQEIESILSVLSESEKNWLRLNYNRFFFGDSEKDLQYQFFTTESPYPFQFYSLAAKVDIAKLSEAALKMAFISDHFYQTRSLYSALKPDQTWVFESDGRKMIVSTKTGIKHEEEADLFLDLGSNNRFENNAGGTGGVRPLSLHLDLKGNNHYNGTHFCQGAGFLGVGGYFSCGGHNTFQASGYSQGIGYFGSGFLVNQEGENKFQIGFGGQSFALFGSSLLINLKGKNQYNADQGMAQAASSTFGVAYLIDIEGSNLFTCGETGKGGTLYGGIGQGGSAGVRHDPWLNNPSLYGGLSYLYLGGGDNHLKTAWLGQGSAYFMGAGILVSEGSNNFFEADYDSQGQGLHLAAGMISNKGDHNQFKGGWGSIGVGGDRSVGILLSHGSHNYFEGTEQSNGSSRKPKALGLFISVGDDNHYTFRKESAASIQLPESPNEWSSALFLELGRGGIYSENVDSLNRGSGRLWGIPDHSKGLSTPKPFQIPFQEQPKSLQISSYAYRPLPLHEELSTLAEKIPTADLDKRRQIYETLDFHRFQNRKSDPDLSFLLNSPASLSEDAFNYAVLFALRNKDRAPIDAIKKALTEGTFSTQYMRKMAVSLVGTFFKPESIPLLLELMQNDPSEEVRYYAALALAIHLSDTSLDMLKPGIENSSERVRYAIARGLQEAGKPTALALIKPLLQDPSFYVRRAAGMTALSLGEKEGVDAVIGTLLYETLDTTDNYGDNIFKQLAEYLGVDFGLDRKAWIHWWQENKDHFQLPDQSVKNE